MRGSDMADPEVGEVRAIDIVPYEHAIYCTVADSEPFSNPIVHRHWSEDGESIWFMLESHNFLSAKPDAMVKNVVSRPIAYRPQDPLQYDNEVFLAKRPQPKRKCEHCDGKGFIEGSREP